VGTFRWERVPLRSLTQKVPLERFRSLAAHRCWWSVFHGGISSCAQEGPSGLPADHHPLRERRQGTDGPDHRGSGQRSPSPDRPQVHRVGVPLQPPGSPPLKQINRIVAVAGERAQVKNPNPATGGRLACHLFRHTFARHWKQRGGDIESLSHILGHASSATTVDLYGTQSIDDVQANYEKLMGVDSA